MKIVIYIFLLSLIICSQASATELVREENTLGPAVEGSWQTTITQKDRDAAAFSSAAVTFVPLLTNFRRYRLDVAYTVSCQHVKNNRIIDLDSSPIARTIIARQGSDLTLLFPARTLTCPQFYRSIGGFAKITTDTIAASRYTVSAGVVELWDGDQ